MEKGASHIQLRRLYLGFNRKWFNGELPNDTVVIWKPVPTIWNAYTTREDGRFLIALCPSIIAFPKYHKLVLLHEMCHVKHWRSTHGVKFQNEMLRLAQAGALRKLW